MGAVSLGTSSHEGQTYMGEVATTQQVHERVYSDEEEEPHLEAREGVLGHEHGQSDN